jgi:CubicO group peptidase (beta-lactamase class C family)
VANIYCKAPATHCHKICILWYNTNTAAMLKNLLVLILCFVLTLPAHAQTFSLDDSLNNIFSNEVLAGMSVVGIRGDSIGYEGNFGRRDLGRGLGVEAATLYRVASVSKSFTAAALMKLYEQGFFGLDEDVNSYLGFSLRNPAYPADKITFRMILSHTSSVQDGTGYDNFLTATGGTTPPPISQLLVPGGAYYTSNMYRTERPGTYFNYSNVEYGIIGTLVERISNVRFDVYVRQNILQPLGITGSFNIDDLAPQINDIAVLYRKVGGSWAPQLDNYNGIAPTPRNYSTYTIGSNGLVFGPQGSLRISAAGLAKFILVIANNGVYKGTRILNDSTVRRMRDTQWNYTGASSGNNYYGLFRRWGNGLHISTGGTADQVFANTVMWGHPGEAYGLISDMYTDTLAKSGVVFITNGKFGPYSSCNTAFYCVEEKVFNAVNQWQLQSPIPVTLSSFTGAKQGTKHLLRWATATETNNQGFELERSADGRTFTRMAYLPTAAPSGYSSQPLSYAFTDATPLSGSNYYRLRQLDKDGKASYSAVVLLQANALTAITITSLYPTPVRQALTIQVAAPTAAPATLLLTDMAGKVLVRKRLSLVAGGNSFTLPVAGLAGGCYLVRLVSSFGEEVRKVVVE